MTRRSIGGSVFRCSCNSGCGNTSWKDLRAEGDLLMNQSEPLSATIIPYCFQCALSISPGCIRRASRQKAA